MNVLIVGATGMLGQALVRVFADAEHVVAWDRAMLDITNAPLVRERIAEVAPTLVVNASAYNAVDEAEKNEAHAHAVNGMAVGHLATAAAECGASFVHFSTDYIFDGESSDGYAEDALPNPVSVYGSSKLLGERMLREVSRTHLAWRWYCIRTSRLFGNPGVSGNAKKSFVDTMLALSETRKSFSLIHEEIASPTYVPDLAVATRDLVFRDAPSGVYHRTNAGRCTWYELGCAVFRRTGWRGTIIPIPASAYPRPARRPACSVLVNTKLSPMRNWEEALDAYLTLVTRARGRTSAPTP